MAYRIDGADFKEILTREFKTGSLCGSVNASPGKRTIFNYDIDHQSSGGLDLLHFKASFEDDVYVDKFSDQTHVSIHFQLTGKSDASIKGITGQHPLTTGQHNLYFCEEPQSNFHFPRQSRYEYLAFIVRKEHLLRLLSLAAGHSAEDLARQMEDGKPLSLYPRGLSYNLRAGHILADVLNNDMPEDLRGLFLNGKLLELISVMIDTSRDCGQRQYSKADYERFSELRHYLDQHFLDSHSLAALSRKFAINEFKLKSGFKANYHCTVFEYISNCRLHYALTLLKSSSMNINQIAWEIGYQNAGSFIQSFKKKFGITPKQYQKSVC